MMPAYCILSRPKAERERNQDNEPIRRDTRVCMYHIKTVQQHNNPV